MGSLEIVCVERCSRYDEESQGNEMGEVGSATHSESREDSEAPPNVPCGPGPAGASRRHGPSSLRMHLHLDDHFTFTAVVLFSSVCCDDRLSTAKVQTGRMHRTLEQASSYLTLAQVKGTLVHKAVCLSGAVAEKEHWYGGGTMKKRQ